MVFAATLYVVGRPIVARICVCTYILRERAQKYQLRGGTITFPLNRTHRNALMIIPHREIVTVTSQSLAQIRRFIRPTPQLDRRQFSPRRTYPRRGSSAWTLIRAIRAGFERDSFGHKSSFGHIRLLVARPPLFATQREMMQWFLGLRIYEAILSLALTQPTNKSFATSRINKCGPLERVSAAPDRRRRASRRRVISESLALRVPRCEIHRSHEKCSIPSAKS